MGYLNYNLEKVASAVEEGMEKQALSLGKLVGMGVNAAHRGKLGHFAKRLAQRNQAMDKVKGARRIAFDKAIPESQLERAFLGVKNGPASLKARRLGHRVPATGDGAAIIADNMNNFLISGHPIVNRNFARALVRRQPVPMDIQSLSHITKSMRTHRPQLLKQLTAGKNLTATAKSPVPLYNMGGSANLTDDIFRAGNLY